MIPPSGYTEKQVISTIDNIVNMVAPSFKFGYFGIDDIKQEATLCALKALPKYDARRPLENFMYRHIKNRLLNLMRDKYRRNDPPCKTCHKSLEGSTSHKDKKYCKKYLSWQARNVDKQRIMSPRDMSMLSDVHEKNTKFYDDGYNNVEIAELLTIINRELDVELRATFLQMKAGENVPKNKRFQYCFC